MDPASLALGTAGLLLQSFNAAVGCVQAIRNFRDASDQNDLLNCQLYIEQYNLTAWGRRCGLTEGLLSQYMPLEETQAIALMVIRNMLDLISETEKLREKYGMNYVPTTDVDTSSLVQQGFGRFIGRQISFPISDSISALRLPPEPSSPHRPSIILPADEEVFRKSIEKGKNAMGFMRRCQWVVSDTKKFEELVKYLNYFNTSLDKLVDYKSYPLPTMEIDLLSNSSETDLSTIERAGASMGLHPELSMLATMRSRVLQSETSPSPMVRSHPTRPQRRLRIELGQLNRQAVSLAGRQTRERAVFQPSHGHSQNVVVEWRQFQSNLTPYTRDATIKRAEGLAVILQKRPRRVGNDIFRILNCVGYCITDEEIGYVFEMPISANPFENPISLLEMLDDQEPADGDVRPPGQIDSPPLEQRFALMQTLCKSLWWLHLGNVVHKGIRSENVIFFKHNGETSVRLTEPYITGFDHSRPDGPDDLTITKAALGTEQKQYRHPDAESSMSQRSTKIHDLYSLGLVLMEISHWLKLRDLIKAENADQFRDQLFNECGPVEDLAHIMGTRLRGIVYRCLRGNFDLDLDDDVSAEALQAAFLKEVVGEIMKCTV